MTDRNTALTPDCPPWRRRRDRLGAYALRFLREEDGTFVVFGVYVFLIILFFAGIGIDLMRFERDRAELQYTLDRAVLAAADLDQQLAPRAVVEDYFTKAGLSDFLASVTVDEGLGYRVVSADASSDMQTQFMHMTGVDSLKIPASSTAEERIGGVEISLVLDVSGSMNSNSRLTNLKDAAKDFVDQMVDNTEDGKLSISIVPYATQVSMPGFMADTLTLTDEHDYSRCVNFESSDFTTTTINPSAEMERTMHFDPWRYWEGRDDNPPEIVGLDGQNRTLPVCEAMANREILPLSKDRLELKSYIDAFTARGNTSIDLGMKWGTALLDPSMQPSVAAMVASGNIDSDFLARPQSYSSSDTLKVIVLMTDGQNTSQYYIFDQYRDADSEVWWNEEEKKYSVYYPYNNMYYWPHKERWYDHAYGNGTYEETTRVCTYQRYGYCYNYAYQTQVIDEPGEAVALSYADLWAYTTMREVVSELYSPWNSNAWSHMFYNKRGAVGSGTKNSRTRSICNAAKDKNIIVFTIGFEAPSSGQAVIEDCASSPAHYFDVDGLEISDAFASIASSIRKLRLTQ